ncbi:MAG: NADH-quinone oxidoreductase subunit D [Promicromonosporaceae bacterium]|nr:NADH-quinone oxidoreductase subunit D [Promicromonosporaceae bacterium]
MNPAFQAARPAGETLPPGAAIVQPEGGDWDEIAREVVGEERILVNMGPQHPSTHGVLRLMLEVDGETITEARAGIGYLHTGIEKSMEYRTWTQGTAFCTRMDYLSPFFQETAYCLGIEALLGIEAPPRAAEIRLLMMELCRISSHLISLGSGGNDMGATTVMTTAFTAREEILRFFEAVTGTRMNHAYIRPGGVAADLPADGIAALRRSLPVVDKYLRQLSGLLLANPIFRARLVGTGYLDPAGCLALGVTGPVARSAGLPYDVRKAFPYCGYETYDFDVPVYHGCDNYDRVLVRIEECYQSLRLVGQVLDRLRASAGQPVMVADKKIAWPAQLSLGGDGQGQSPTHVAEILGDSMEALIHHFKLVTEGFSVPAGQAWTTVEHPRGELGVHLVSAGGNHPYRAHFRDPSFNNLQTVSLLCEGGQLADVVVSIASLDPVMGGVDR